MIRTTETAAINEAVDTLHTTVAGRDAETITYYDLSDQALSAGALTHWAEHRWPRDGGAPDCWTPLFLMPGMTHCG